MSCPAGEKNEEGEFAAHTVHGKVYEKLKTFAKVSEAKG